jgi:hypothetical protein
VLLRHTWLEVSGPVDNPVVSSPGLAGWYDDETPYQPLTFSSPIFAADSNIEQQSSALWPSPNPSELWPSWFYGDDSVSSSWVALDESQTAINLAVATAVSDTTLDAVALTQVHGLAVSASNTATTGSTVALTQAQQLTVANAVSATTASTPAVDQATQLAVSPASTATLASAPALTQAHALAVSGGTTATTASTSTITQSQQLAVAGAVSTTQASTPAIDSSVALAVGPASTATSASTPALTQQHALTVASATSNTSLSTPAITVGAGAIDLTVAPSVTVTSLSTVAITQDVQPEAPIFGGGDGSTRIIRRYQRVPVVHQLSISPAASKTALSSVAVQRGVILVPSESDSSTELSAVHIERFYVDGALLRHTQRPRLIREARR